MSFKFRISSTIACGLILGVSSFSAQADKYEDGLMAYAVGNFQEAASNFTSSAEEGNLGAQHMLLRMLSEGKMYSANLDADTFELALKAAQQGLAPAQFSLAELYIKRGDAKSAVNWYRKAATQNHIAATYELGQLLKTGAKDVSADQDESQRLLGIAASELDVHAQKGSAEAQNSLASMYEKGLGVKKNIQLAARWYDSAARQGHAQAQLNLGRLYIAGTEGVPSNPYQAKYWLDLAAAQGVEEAIAMLKDLKTSSDTRIAFAM